MANTILHERLRRPSSKRDLLNAFLAGSDGHGTPIHRDQVHGEVMATLIAGGDSTAMTILGCLGFLLQSPAVLHKLREEFAHAKASGMVAPQGPAEVAKFADLQKLPYLSAVISETLRLTPAIGAAFWRRVPEGGCEVEPGVWVPGGAEIGVNNWIFGRNEEVYGEDAGQFRPERWLDEEERRRLGEYDFGFGHGNRV
jgi:cytochrome P450